MTTTKVESGKYKVENEHTPGPWTNGHRHPCRIIAGGFLVASTCEVPDEGTESDTQIANARLIAAAPDLLAACRLALQRLCQLEHEDHLRIGWSPARKAVEAAIAKAEGRAQ